MTDFEEWIREECFSEPPKFAYDLAKAAFKAGRKCQPPEAVVPLNDLLNALSIITKELKRLDAPVKTTYATQHYQYIIGIGNDHVATLTIDEDALKALNDMSI